MEALGWIFAVLGWIFGIAGIFCLIVTIIALTYPEIVLIEELILGRKSKFLLFDINKFDVDKDGHKYIKNHIHFFVDQPNEIVIPIVDLGNNLQEFVINSDHKGFHGLGTNKERWKIVNKNEATPQQYLSNVGEWYRAYIQRRTGRTYIGFYPFRKVATKTIKKLHKLPDAHENWFEEEESITHHLRVRPFIWYFQLPETDVAGIIPLSIWGSMLEECVNPYEAWYGIDNFASFLSDAPVSATRHVIKGWSLEDVVATSLEEDTKPEKVAEGVKSLAKRRLEEELPTQLVQDYGSDGFFGFKIAKVQIFDAKPIVTPEVMEKLRAPIYAQLAGKAYKTERDLRAKADAAYLETLGVQMKEPHGRFITEQDTKRLMAKESNSTIIFDNAGNGTTPSLEKALMLVAKRLEENSKDESDKEQTKEKPSK